MVFFLNNLSYIVCKIFTRFFPYICPRCGFENAALNLRDYGKQHFIENLVPSGNLGN